MSKNNITVKISKSAEGKALDSEESIERVQDGEAAGKTTYDLLLWLFRYSQTLFGRVGKDFIISFIRYVFPTFPLPHYISELIAAQNEFKALSGQQPSAYNRFNIIKKKIR